MQELGQPLVRPALRVEHQGNEPEPRIVFPIPDTGHRLQQKIILAQGILFFEQRLANQVQGFVLALAPLGILQAPRVRVLLDGALEPLDREFGQRTLLGQQLVIRFVLPVFELHKLEFAFAFRGAHLGLLLIPWRGHVARFG